MLNQKKTILYLQKNKIQVKTLSVGEEIKIINSQDYKIDGQNFLKIFKDIRKKFDDDVRILLNEKQSYVVVVSIPDDEKNIDQKIKQGIQNIIPVELDQLVYDSKKTFTNQKKSFYQIFAVEKELFEILSLQSKKADLNIEAVESLSLALARLIRDDDQPKLVIYKQEETVALVVCHNTVLLSITLTSLSEIGNILNQIKKQYCLDIKKAVLSGVEKDEIKEFLNKRKISIIERNLNPLLSLYKKKDVVQKKYSDLNLKMISKPLKKIIKEKKTLDNANINKKIFQNGCEQDYENLCLAKKDSNVKQIKQKKKKPNVIIIFIILPILLFSSIFITMKSMKKESKKINYVTPPTISPTEIHPSPTPEDNKADLSREDIAMELINSSGIDEKSDEIKDHLESLGYEGITITDSNLEEEMLSLIRVKKTSKDYLELVLSDLEEKISTPSTEINLENDYLYDISIIIGKDST